MFEPDPETEPGPRRSDGPADDRLPPLARVVFYLPAYLIAQLVTAGFAAALWLVATGRQLPDLEAIENELSLAVGLGAVFLPVLLLGTWAFARGLDDRSLGDLGWRLPATSRRTVVETLGAGGGGVLLLALWFAIGSWGFDVQWSGWATLGPRGVLSVSGLGMMFGGLALAAAAEELAFRGYVFRALKDRGTWASAAGLQAAFFALLHASNPEITAAALANTFLLGLVLAALVQVTGSLYAATLVHTLWNFLVALGLPLSGFNSLGVAKITLTGPDGWTGGAYGPEGSWVLTALLVASVFALAPWADRAQLQAAEPEV